jgi:tRNA threonylcarbamoyladenosine biosynthesis protein TsaB
MLLAIDTCGPLGGVALGGLSSGDGAGSRDSGGPLAWSRELAGKSYSESLLPAIDELLRGGSATLGQIAAVVVVRGPGSFTGIRIGVSAAKGCAEGLGIPLIALSRLELLARQGPATTAVAVLDAGRGEFYAGFYLEGICETEVLLTRDALSQAVAGSRAPVIVCEQEVLLALEELRPILVAVPTAVEALALGAERFRAGVFDDVATLEANYLRRSENEILARVANHAALKELSAQVPSATE